MKKYFILFFGLFLFVFVPGIHAQPQNKSGFKPVCLDAQWCRDVNCPSGAKHVHRSALSTTNFKAVPSSPSYILECVEADPDPICTTGNSELDIELFCPDKSKMNDEQIEQQCNHYGKLIQADIGYSLTKDGTYGIWHFDPQLNKYIRKDETDKQSLIVQSDGQGNIIPIEWQSFTPSERMRKFMVYNDIEGTADVSREGGSLSQATLAFIFRSEDCKGNAYDPDGVVFDMMTLEPIPHAQVTLEQLNAVSNDPVDISIANPHIVNPFPTSSLGYFTFYVVDGNYVLIPVHPDYDQALSVDSSLLPVNANRIYSDFYYQDSSVIRQRGEKEHRDIVMKPKNGVGYHYDIELLDETKREENGRLLYSGFLSHPFVLLNVEICTPGATEVCNLYKEFDHRNGGPDIKGKFNITLDQSVLDIAAGQYFNMKFEKQDLVTATLTRQTNIVDHLISWVKQISARSIGTVHAQNKSTLESKVEPIPVYLEGYAYDNTGSIIPNATVGVYMYLFTQRPIYQTSADANGFFRITTEHIPSAEYTLRFTSPENPENVSYQTTSQFLANNNAFIKAEKIKPYKSTSTSTNPRKNVTPSFVPQQKISPLVTVVSPTQSPVTTGGDKATTTTATSRNPVYLVGAVLLILLAGAGVMLAMYVYKKRSQEEAPPKTE